MKNKEKVKEKMEREQREKRVLINEEIKLIPTGGVK